MDPSINRNRFIIGEKLIGFVKLWSLGPYDVTLSRPKNKNVDQTVGPSK